MSIRKILHELKVERYNKINSDLELLYKILAESTDESEKDIIAREIDMLLVEKSYIELR